MAERLSGPWPEQLELLLERLRHDGFGIGMPERLRLQQLLVGLVDRGVPLDDPQRLARLLGPVLCRTASEQQALSRHVQAWWPGPVLIAQDQAQQPDPAPAEPATLAEALAGVERRRQRILRWLPTGPLAVLAGTGLAAAAVVRVVQVHPRPITQIPIPEFPPPQPDPTPPPTPGPTPPPTPTPTPTPTPDPTPDLTPADPTATLLPGRERAPLLLPSEGVLLTALAGLLSWAAVQGLVRGWWWREARRLVLQRLPLQGELQLHRIALGAIEAELVPLPELHRIGRALNVWQRRPSDELDAAATVEASLRQGGWLTPRHGERRERLSYLFLLDQDSLVDQQARHLRAWLERLRHEGVLADWVCFQHDPMHCLGPTGHGPLSRLDQLAIQHPEAVAVVVADAERFYSPVDGTPQPWLDTLAAWPRRALLTPAPRARWGALEHELQQQLPVLPVSVEGLLGLGRLLQGAPPGPLPIEVDLAPAPEPRLLRGSSAPWLDRTPPAPELVRQLLEQLRAHLGPEGFQWLAACAVFPQLHWSITAYLGQRLANGAGEPLVQCCPLLRLARLPWLRHGYMPDWLRLPLIVALDGPQQTAVRQALGLLLMGAASGRELGGAELQVATGSSQRLPRLLPPLIEQLRRRASPTSPLHDQLFLRFLQNRPLLAADAPDSLRRLLPPRATGLGPRGLAIATLLLLGLGGLGLAMVRQLQLAWIDQLLQNPPEATETLRLQRAITALGLSRTSLMRLGPDPDLRGVERALTRGMTQVLEQGPPLKGYEGWVYSVAYSPDGRQIASGSADRTVRVWDAKSGAPLGPPLKGHEGVVWSVAYSPDGRQIASGSDDRTVRVWDAKSGAPLGPPLKGHGDWVRSVAYSPDGRQIASGSDDRTVRVWDAKSGAPLGPPLKGHEGGVGSVAYSPDGRQIASGGDDRTVRVWDAKSGAPLGPPLKGHEGWVLSVAYSPDGRQIASGSADQTVRVWDAKSGAPLGPPLKGHGRGVNSVAYSPDGRQIASGGEDGTVRVWDAKSGAPLGPPLKGHEGGVNSVAYSPDGRQIASGGDDGTVRVWAESQPWQRTLPIACRRLAIHPSLHDLPWLNSARATCRHFTGLPQASASAPSPAAWLAAGAGLGAAGLVLAQRRRLRSLAKTKPIPTAPEPAPDLRHLTVISAQLHSQGDQWLVERREVTVQSVEEPLGDGLSLRLIQIPAGSFAMGSPEDEPFRSSNEGPQHEVSVAEFCMAQTPITQAQWRAVAKWQPRQGEKWGRKLNPNPSRFKGKDRPVEQVTWLDAMEFCNRVSQRTGRHYSLPSEAQWEYACRAGSTSPFAFGATLTAELANYDARDSYGDGPKGEYRKQTTPVGMFPANAWGLQDMHGNVFEWCLDHWHDNYERAPSDGSPWLKPSGSDEHRRLLRGGSWYDDPRYCRSACRNRNLPDDAFYDIGLRVVCLPQGSSLNP